MIKVLQIYVNGTEVNRQNVITWNSFAEWAYALIKSNDAFKDELLAAITQYNEIYKQAGAVHGCALCQGNEILTFVEDVGRHNAADAISGKMWLEDIPGNDKIFYTTGRLTSEIVMKVTHMGIPILLSRSGVTHMGLDLARDLGVTMIARAKGKAFLVYNGSENIIYDQTPKKPPQK